ncbi:EF-hand domain-containing protein [Streptomyces sp. SR27]|uniref:EF-hand domain-containing protein n=1 Tax=Streptomyces sp. SR27 TaxID=3076630 RepID=UPI00295A8AB1|nr:EF-hand domain-containing protein [Streptomyces sp. SR27]MDV9190561.1 EF-hand domain-containing protein [Streptomyces sp. SR27]
MWRATARAASTRSSEWIYRALGVDGNLSAETFARIDLNGDGFVSVDEFVNAARDVWSSNDPKAAGAVMFGPLN